MAPELFELSLLGGAYERSYRRLRPEIERMPWGSLDASAFPPASVARGRRFWTQAAYQEHRTAAACAATVEALLVARAPIDLVAEVSRFLVDELAHVELCARVAAALGGGAPLRYDGHALSQRQARELPPLVAAAELVVRVFCVGEAFSVPMQRVTARAASHPLFRMVISRIAKDEAAHGRFGWVFLDWAGELLDDRARAHLGRVARQAISALERSFIDQPPSTDGEPSLGWLAPATYAATARRVMAEDVCEPLRIRGLLDGAGPLSQIAR